MTYCVGLALKDGLVLLSDSRTSAGVDNISIFSKMHLFQIPGERFLALLTAGNLAITQSVVNLLHEGVENQERVETLYTVQSPFRAAQLVGDVVRRVFEKDGAALQAQNIPFDVSVLLGGEIKGHGMRMFQLYSAGNFIEATPDTPFLQIGEHKYGKPILDRVVTHDVGVGPRLARHHVALEHNPRELPGVQKVRRPQVVVPLRLARVDARRVRVHHHADERRRGVVRRIDLRRKRLEAAPHRRDPHVLDREIQVRVAGVAVPLHRSHPPRCTRCECSAVVSTGTIT